MDVMERERIPGGLVPASPRAPSGVHTGPAIHRAPAPTTVPPPCAPQRRSVGAGPFPGGWQPLTGDALLERVRVTGRPRPPADPERAARLRRCIEDGMVPGDDDPPDPPPLHPGVDGSLPGRGHPLVVTKDRVTRVLACEAHHVAAEFGERTPTTALAVGALVDTLFRQLVTTGSIDDPMTDGLDGLSMDERQADLVAWIGRLPRTERDGVRAEVDRQAEELRNRWPRLDPVWLPRTQEVMRTRLVGGAVELSARVDLAVGRPEDDRSSVALIEVKSGTRRIEHRADLHFYALVATLRNPAPPFAVATYYTRTGELDVDPVTDELLAASARRTLAGIRRLRYLAAGAAAGRSPGAPCGPCAVLPGCAPGRRHTGAATVARGQAAIPTPAQRAR